MLFDLNKVAGPKGRHAPRAESIDVKSALKRRVGGLGSRQHFNRETFQHDVVGGDCKLAGEGVLLCLGCINI